MATALMQGIAAAAELSTGELVPYAAGGAVAVAGATGVVIGMRRVWLRWRVHWVRHPPPPATDKLLGAESHVVDEESGLATADADTVAKATVSWAETGLVQDAPAGGAAMVDVALSEPSVPQPAPPVEPVGETMSPNKRGKQPMRAGSD